MLNRSLVNVLQDYISFKERSIFLNEVIKVINQGYKSFTQNTNQDLFIAADYLLLKVIND